MRKAGIGINPIALRTAKIVHNFGLSECYRVNFCVTADVLTKVLQKCSLSSSLPTI